MKTKITIAALALLGGVSAMALPTVVLTDGPGGANGYGGGIFYASTSDGQNFQTYCLEYTEHIYLGTTYEYAISSAALNGGTDLGNGLAGSDPISGGTAWLYRKYGQTVNTTAAADSLQMAIWMLEDEFPLSTDPGNAYYAEALLHGGKLDSVSSDVFAMNLSDLDNSDGLGGTRRQDVLISVPDGGITLGMLGVGLMAFGALRRRLA